jgi:tRNA pseudouridine38-40 synthase
LATRRLKIILQYDGEPYCGWQFQANGPSVQQTVEEALARMMGRKVRLIAAGRTDAGVHAAALPAHFDTDHSIPAERLPLALAPFLPDSIGILSAEQVGPEFDARRGAILRWYRYQIVQASRRRPLGPRAWQVHHPLDLGAIGHGLEMLRGHHDFNGFRSSHCQSSRTELTMQGASLTRVGDLLALDFKCRSFLHHMIRFMAGTLVAMGRGQIDQERFLKIRDQGERPQLIYCAPPHGLCLMAVAYGEEERQRILAANPAPPRF